MTTKIPIIIIVFLLFYCNCYAAPSISGKTGDMSSGETVTISGSDFGSKSPAAPILWDTFDGDWTDGEALTDDEKWIQYSGPVPGCTVGAMFSSTDPYSGTFSAHNRILGPTAADYVAPTEFDTNNYFFDATDTVYYSYMSRYTVTGDTYGVVKNGRVNAYPNTYGGDGCIIYSNGKTIADTGSGNIEDWFGEHKRSTWTRHEMYKRNSTPGVADGEAWWAINYDEAHYDNYVTRESGYTFQHTNILLGLEVANAINDGDHRLWVDDVYVDNTRARVELCSGSTWANRTACDPQIPSAWSNTSVTATVNQGAFADDSTAYLYVVDAAGAVNSSGYEVTISGGSSSLTSGSGTGGKF